MQDEIDLPPVIAPRRSGKTTALIALAAFIIGGGTVGWLVGYGSGGRLLSAQQNVPVHISPSNTALPADARVSALETRLTRIEQQAATSDGKTAHAEALLTAFATRRTLDRGAPLGALEGQLQQRFGAAHSDAVAAIITAARYPVTREMLNTQLDSLAPRIGSTEEKTSGWSRFKQQVSNLFVLRRERHEAPDQVATLAQVHADLDDGNVGKAIIAMEQMPQAERATAWIAAARRYDAGQKALDVIEQAALQ